MTQGTKVLLVEDDYDIAEAMIDVLVDQGYLVAHASNGREPSTSCTASSTRQ